MIEAGIAALLLADSGVSALLGTRIYPVKLPDETDVASVGACLTYQDITATPEFTINKTKWTEKRIQFDAYSVRSDNQSGGGYGNAKAVLAAVANVLDGYEGPLSDGTRIILAYQTIETDNFENDSRVFRCLCEYQISYSTN